MLNLKSNLNSIIWINATMSFPVQHSITPYIAPTPISTFKNMFFARYSKAAGGGVFTVGDGSHTT